MHPDRLTVTLSAGDTRQLLVDAALRAFAERGVHAASLLDITRQAGQRNRGAVHYHFGGRDGLVVAVLEEQADLLAEREAQMLRWAADRPDDDLAAVVEAVVRPLFEVGETGWRGRCYLVVVGELIEQDPASLAPEVAGALVRTGGRPVYQLLEERMVPLGLAPEIALERQALMYGFLLRAIADRARAADLPHRRRQPLPTEVFVANLVAMGTGMLTAPQRPTPTSHQELP